MEIDYFNFDQCKQNFKYLSHLNNECFVSFLAKHLLLDFYSDSRKLNTNKAFAFEYDVPSPMLLFRMASEQNKPIFIGFDDFEVYNLDADTLERKPIAEYENKWRTHCYQALKKDSQALAESYKHDVVDLTIESLEKY